MPVPLSALVVLYDMPLGPRLLRQSGERHGTFLEKVPPKIHQHFHTTLRGHELSNSSHEY